MHFRGSFLILLVISLAFILPASAQPAFSDDTDTQSWNEVQLSIPVHEKVDINLTTTIRIARDLTRFNEGRIGGGIGIKLNDSFSTAAGYNYIESRNAIGRFVTEHRYHVNGVYKFPFKKFGLSHRSQYEYRVRASGNSWRYRPSITIEKKLPESFIKKAKVFVTEEPFYVSTTGKFSRNRFSAGIKKTVNDNFSFDVYYLRQNDGYSRPGDLHVIGISWKFAL